MDITLRGVQPKYAGRCPVCGQQVTRLFDAVLGDTPDGRPVPVHASCAGGKWQSKVKGPAWVGPSFVTVD